MNHSNNLISWVSLRSKRSLNLQEFEKEWGCRIRVMFYLLKIIFQTFFLLMVSTQEAPPSLGCYITLEFPQDLFNTPGPPFFHNYLEISWCYIIKTVLLHLPQGESPCCPTYYYLQIPRFKSISLLFNYVSPYNVTNAILLP